MPAVPPRYVPATETKAAQAIDDLAKTERETRAAVIDRSWKYYTGEHQRPLKVPLGKRDDNVIVNLCAQALDKLVAFFAGPTPPAFQLPGETPKPGDDSPAQQALTAFWTANDLESFLIDLALAGTVSGHAWVKLLPPSAVGAPPEIALLDTRQVTAFWDGMQFKRPLWYRLEWLVDKDTDRQRRQDLVPAWLLSEQPVYAADSEWKIIEYERSRDSGGLWKEQSSDSWAFPFAPLVQWKNTPLPHSFYGASHLKHAALNDSVNFVVSNTSRIIKYHAHPKTTISGANLSDLKESAVEGIFQLPAGTVVNNLEMQSDLGSSMRMYELLRAAFFTQMRVVDWASQADKVGQLTNFGLRVLFSDMVDNVNALRRAYGEGLADLSQRALWLMGHRVEKPQVIWQDPLPTNRLETAQALKTELELGQAAASARTMATELGRDFDQEQENKGEEDTNTTDQMADQLSRLTTAGGFGGFPTRATALLR